MAFIRKAAWIMESARRVEGTEQSKTVSCTEAPSPVFQENQNAAFDRDVTVRPDDFFSMNQ
jgi:hypothetical protein